MGSVGASLEKCVLHKTHSFPGTPTEHIFYGEKGKRMCSVGAPPEKCVLPETHSFEGAPTEHIFSRGKGKMNVFCQGAG